MVAWGLNGASPNRGRRCDDKYGKGDHFFVFFFDRFFFFE
jgi:hypothetical protein